MVGTVAGGLAFVGMLALWFVTKSAMASLAQQTVDQLKATGKQNAIIEIEFNPFSWLTPIFSMGGLITLLLVIVVGLSVYIVRNRTATS